MEEVKDRFRYAGVLLTAAFFFLVFSCVRTVDSNGELGPYQLEVRSPDKEITTISVAETSTELKNTAFQIDGDVARFSIEFNQGREIKKVVFRIEFSDGSTLLVQQTEPRWGQKLRLKLLDGRIVSREFSIQH